MSQAGDMEESLAVSRTKESRAAEGLPRMEGLRRFFRFSLPHNATIILLARETPDLLCDEGHTVWPLALASSNDTQSSDHAMIVQIKELREKGATFLLIAASAWEWFALHVQFKQYIEQHYRVTLREENVGVVFALQEPPDAEWRMQGAPDGLPLPPPELVALVTGMPQVQPFYWSGLLGARCIKGLLNKNGFDMTRFSTILDFGCGCGRVLRHWQTLNGPRLFGTDYNPYLINWCRRAFPFAQFSTNDLSPPLAYADAQFDLVYTISIFTHLEASLQFSWITELSRVLKPGGILFLTVHGTTHTSSLPLAQQQQFAAGEMVVYSPELSGSNRCTAYHPEVYVRNVLARELTVIDFIPGGAKDANQDVFLLQKPVAGRQR
jgi:SAM-dependent methyltransferase